MIDNPMRAVQMLMITSITCHQQCFSMRNTEIKGRNNATPTRRDRGSMVLTWKKP
jgi:hypothetical protein